jgi:regulation of enolase protein 1 (concanavalin A-like superfamily)
MSGLKFTNSTQDVPREADLPTEFSITATSSTDVWSKPPSTEAFNAPILHKTVPLSTFHKARVAVSANWVQLYDQGGLIFVVNSPDGTRKWVKTGIEFVDNTANVSTVAKDRWADWSLLPIIPAGGHAATIEMVREDGSLWIYLNQGLKRTPIREVTWAFEDEGEKECWIGIYAAKPSKDGPDLVVSFRHLVIDLSG